MSSASHVRALADRAKVNRMGRRLENGMDLKEDDHYHAYRRALALKHRAARAGRVVAGMPVLSPEELARISGDPVAIQRTGAERRMPHDPARIKRAIEIAGSEGYKAHEVYQEITGRKFRRWAWYQLLGRMRERGQL